MKRYTLLLPFFMLVLASCGARRAEPVAVQSSMDDRLSCAHLQGEVQANQARLLELRSERERRGRDTVGLLLVAPTTGLLFLDDGSAQRTEAEALEQRNTRLQTLIAGRRCPAA